MILYCDNDGKIIEQRESLLPHAGYYVDPCFRVVVCDVPDDQRAVAVEDFGPASSQIVPIRGVKSSIDYAEETARQAPNHAEVRNVKDEGVGVNPRTRQTFERKGADVVCKHFYRHARVKMELVGRGGKDG